MKRPSCAHRFQQPELRGAFVTLDPLSEAHAAALFPVLRDPELWRYTDDAPPVCEAALAARYRRLEARRSPDGTQLWLNWAVLLKSEAIGFVQATILNEAAHIAYVIGRRHQSRGHATDAVSTMLVILARAFNVRIVQATVDASNGSSRRLLERLNFTLVDAQDMHNLRYQRVGFESDDGGNVRASPPFARAMNSVVRPTSCIVREYAL